MTPVFRLVRRAAPRHRDTFVHRIADQVAPQVMRRLSDTATMSAAELRGYVRARACDVVRAEVRQNLTDERWPITRENELIADVLDRIVHLIIRGHFAPPVVSIPIPHVRSLAAA